MFALRKTKECFYTSSTSENDFLRLILGKKQTRKTIKRPRVLLYLKNSIAFYVNFEFILLAMSQRERLGLGINGND